MRAEEDHPKLIMVDLLHDRRTLSDKPGYDYIAQGRHHRLIGEPDGKPVQVPRGLAGIDPWAAHGRGFALVIA